MPENLWNQKSTQLLDVPEADDGNVYGQPGQTLVVNEERNGLEWGEAGGGAGTVTSVNGIPPDENGDVEIPLVPGPPGPANTLTIGSVTTGEVDVQITGTAPSQQLHFTLPEGQQGEPGPPNTLTVGTVTSGPTAQVTITNTAPNQTISFVLPKGDPGDNGIAEAPQDGSPYSRQDAGWVPAVPLVGGLIPVEFIDPSLVGTPSFIDSWDADTNTPTVPAANTVAAGRYYIVSVAGATDLDGITTWGVGDLAISTGTVWKRIPSNAALGITTINGKTGSVVNLIADDITGISEVGKTGQWDDILNKPLRVYNISASGIFQNGDQIGLLIADREITFNTSNTNSTIICNPGAPGIITGKVIHGVTEVGWTIPNTATAGAFDSAVDITLQAGEFLLFTMDTSLVTPLALGFMLKEVEI